MVSKIEPEVRSDLAERVRQTFDKASIFKDAQTLDHNFIPPDLPCRQEEFLRLSHFFKPLADHKDFNAVQLAIIGAPGVGKTVLSKLFCAHLVAVLHEFNVNLIYAYYNCHYYRTKNAILRDLLTKRFLLTSRGYSDYELLSLLHLRLKKENMQAVLILDNADALKADQILGLIHSGDGYQFGDARISLILLSRATEYQKLLKIPLAGHLTQLTELKGYTKAEFVEILTFRSTLAFHPTIIPNNIIQQVADLAFQRQNLRYGLALLYYAGKLADRTQKPCLTGEMIETARNDEKAEDSADQLTGLRLHELLAALGIAERLKHNGITTTILDEAYVYYCTVCKKYALRPKAKPTFRHHLAFLAQRGLIHTITLPLKRGGRGRRGRLTIPHIPVDSLRTVIQTELELVLKKIGKH